MSTTIADRSLYLAAIFRQRGLRLHVPRGSTVFYEGQPYRGIYLLTRGNLKWHRLDDAGNGCVLKIYGAGDIAGLPPLFDSSPNRRYVATLEAITDAEVFHWPDRDVHMFARQNPESLLALNVHLCQALKDLVEQTSAVSLKSVPTRLFEYLERLGANWTPVSLPLRKHELAQALNTCPESLSRAFRRLTRDGLIYHENGKYRVCKPVK